MLGDIFGCYNLGRGDRDAAKRPTMHKTMRATKSYTGQNVNILLDSEKHSHFLMCTMIGQLKCNLRLLPILPTCVLCLGDSFSEQVARLQHALQGLFILPQSQADPAAWQGKQSAVGCGVGGTQLAGLNFSLLCFPVAKQPGIRTVRTVH